MENKLNKDLKWGSEKLRECIDILKQEYPNLEFELKDSGDQIDREISGDVLVHNMENETTELWAIKFRRSSHFSYQNYKNNKGDVTVEYQNAVNTKYQSEGDWFRFKGGIIKKYVYGWASPEMTLDEKKIMEFFVIDVDEMMKIPKCLWKGPIPNKEHGMSNFYAINIDKLNNCILKKIIKNKEGKNDGDGIR